jgi:pimeloyl-ACP methyl ester carboxylesterase
MQRFANASEFEDFRNWSLDLDDERLLALESAQRIELQVEEALQVWHQFGDSTKAPLVLLHGGSGSWTHWIRNVLPLSKERCIYAVDLPGMGDSEVPRGAVDADDVADAIALGMEKLLGRVPVEVMGFSFGGLSAGFIASRHPELVKRLIMVGIPALGLFGPPMRLRGLLPGMEREEVLEVMHNNLMAMMLAREESMDEPVLHLQAHNVLRDRLRKRRLARGDCLLQEQKKWTCGVHSIWGERDVLYKDTMALIPSALSNCHHLSHHVIKNAGHWVMYERAQEFNNVVLEILSDE